MTRQSKKQKQQSGLKLKYVEPMTRNQEKAFDAYFKDNNLLMHGLPGTGKTFLAIYFALRDIEDGLYRKLIIVRSAVPTRDMGFMPGNATEKAKIYESPYYDIATELYGRGDAYDIHKQKKTIEFMTTSHIRGITLDNSVVVVDEAQNLSQHELHSVLTRMGNNSRLVICGDVRQDDLTNPRYKECSGLRATMDILDTMNSIVKIEFVEDDIVRSGFVKDYIIAKDRYERNKIDVNVTIPERPKGREVHNV